MLPALPLALAVVAAAAGGHGRVVLSATAGGGWASDVLLGARLGAGALALVSPGARLDLSLAPRVKLSAGGAVSLSRHAAAGFWAVGEEGAVEGRLLGERWELSLAAGGEHAAWASAVPLGEVAGGPPVTATAAALLVPQALVRLGPLALRGATTLAYRESRAAGATVPERGLAALAALEWRAHARATLELEARHERVASDEPAFALVAWGAGAGAALRPAGQLSAAVRLQGERTRLDSGGGDTLWRAALELSHPVGPAWAVVSAAWLRSLPRSPELEPASRTAVLVAVRGRVRALAW